MTFNFRDKIHGDFPTSLMFEGCPIRVHIYGDHLGYNVFFETADFSIDTEYFTEEIKEFINKFFVGCVELNEVELSVAGVKFTV